MIDFQQQDIFALAEKRIDGWVSHEVDLINTPPTVTFMPLFRVWRKIKHYSWHDVLKKDTKSKSETEKWIWPEAYLRISRWRRTYYTAEPVLIQSIPEFRRFATLVPRTMSAANYIF